MLLDRSLERPCAELRIVSRLGQKRPRTIVDCQCQLLISQTRVHAVELNVDNLAQL